MIDGSSNDLRGLKWLNLVAYVTNVVFTYGIGVAGWFGSSTNAELSAKYQTLLTPAGWAFSIWGVIFTVQFVWVAQQFFLAQRSSSSADLVEAIATVRCNYLFVVLAQVGWTVSFSQEALLVSACMMLLLLWNLAVIVFSLSKLDATESLGPPTIKRYFLTVFPFAIHFGWILAAWIVNINVVLVSEFSKSVQYYGGAIGGLAAVLIAALILIYMRYRTEPLVLVWALLGIFVELSSSPSDSITEQYSTKEIDSIRYGTVGVLSVILLALAVSVWRQMRSSGNSSSSAEEDSGTEYVRASDGAGRL